jgi:hypothetical protein
MAPADTAFMRACQVALRYAVLLGCVFCPVLRLPAQIVPDREVLRFKLPRYGESSYRAYTLSGLEGKYLSKDVFEAREVRLEVYSGDEGQELQTTLFAPVAEVNFPLQRASGCQTIEVSDPDYSLFGSEWTLDLKEKRIHISAGGHLIFRGELGLDLSHLVF